MARVLIASLGTGRPKENEKDPKKRGYQTADYVFNKGTAHEKEYCKKHFVAEAIIEHCNIDKVFFIGTKKSIWEKVYDRCKELIGKQDNVEYIAEDAYFKTLQQKTRSTTYNSSTLSYVDLEPLNSLIDQAYHTQGSQCILIDYGVNERELINNMQEFKNIGDSFQDNDEIYLDITHSFRSLALLQYMMINYIENVCQRKIQVAGVFYGMNEIRREYKKVEKREISPVINLKPIYELTDWSKAVYSLRQYGNGYLLSTLLEPQQPQLAAKIKAISDSININDLQTLGQGNEGFVMPDVQTQPAAMMMDHVKEFISRFDAPLPDSELQLQMTKWHFDNKRYASGYICLAEAYISKICEVFNYQSRIKNQRAIAKAILTGKHGQGNLANSIKQLFKQITKIRDMIAHTLNKDTKVDFANAIIDANKYYHKTVELFVELSKCDPLDCGFSFKGARLKQGCQQGSSKSCKFRYAKSGYLEKRHCQIYPQDYCLYPITLK